ACFIVIGLITHVISNLLPEKKKPNIAVKMVLNLLAGLLVGYALLVPAAYYPAKAERLIDVADDLGVSIDFNTDSLSKYKVNEKLYSFILNVFDRFEFEGIELSIDKTIDDLEKLSSISNLLNNTSRWSDIADKINSEDISDAFYCLLLSDSGNKNEVIKGVSEIDMTMQEKIEGTKAIINSLSLFTNVHSTVDDFRQFMADLDPSSCQSAAKIFDRVRLDSIDINIGRNAPLIASLFRAIGTMSDKSDEKLAKEAEALSYFLIPQNAATSVFDFERLDPLKALDYIMNSEVIRNSFIEVTNGGEIFNPCRIKNRISPTLLKSLFTLIQSTYGVSADDALFKSLQAYFAIEG
ncbi:MAG: hypothetical protein II712_00560, partial [Erysipelotrichaceae bacterium]|nr:hypothetical protein [Erysipelotrichaceae bacterium]